MLLPLVDLAALAWLLRVSVSLYSQEYYHSTNNNTTIVPCECSRGSKHINAIDMQSRPGRLYIYIYIYIYTRMCVILYIYIYMSLRVS